ncbi:glutathione S-transferase family protein [Acidisphaera sp. L21]|uniref:glutathione S-transferase family protein n=1 Tax=Acidisphaera sp. L21 TaxID=1641851 RepID=UPI00131C99B1|nr:glutathione S-transferase family protein [Acidisphaera sp. L21]
MKLLYQPSSPFGRKVMVCAIAREIDDQIVTVLAGGESEPVVGVNPLGKIPCLVANDGTELYDSRVICEFLDGVGSSIPLFPDHGLRMRALRLQALADGISDAAVLRRGEQSRPSEPARDDVIEKQKRKVARSLAVLEADVPADHLDIGTIAVACALGYLDLRFADEPWRDAHPALAAWFAKMMERPCLARTIP